MSTGFMRSLERTFNVNIFHSGQHFSYIGESYRKAAKGHIRELVTKSVVLLAEMYTQHMPIPIDSIEVAI